MSRILITALALLAGPLAASDLLPDPQTLVEHRAALELRDDQVASLRELAAAGQADLGPLKDAARRAERRLDAALEAVPLDVAEARAAGDALLDAERAVKAHILDVLLRAQAILDDEQRRRMLRHLRGSRGGDPLAGEAVARVRALAERLEAAGGDVGGLEERLREIAALMDRGETARAKVLLRETADELERRVAALDGG